MHGDWRELSDEMRDAFIHRLFQPQDRPVWLRELGAFHRVRMVPLECYPGWMCVEALVLKNEVPATAWLLYGPFGAFAVDGSSELLHRLNGAGVISLRSDVHFIEYLHMFCSNTRGDEGPFFVVENTDRLEALLGQTIADKQIKNTVKSPQIIETTADSRLVSATVVYGAEIFTAVFNVSVNGEVEMTDDEPLNIDIGETVFSYSGHFFLPRSVR